METAIRSEPSVRFESFELNLRTGELYRNGLRVKLRGHPVDVLAILLEHPGELVTREALKKRLWPDNTFVDFEQILNNSIGKLRDALGDQADSPKFIETLPRLGYRFIAQVEKSATRSQPLEDPNQAAQDALATEPVPAVPQTARSGGHRILKEWLIWPLLAFAIACAAFAYRYARTPLPAPRITHYEQLTLDGRKKAAGGTDGARLYIVLMGMQRAIAQVPVSGGKVTEIPIDLPPGAGSGLGLVDVSPEGSSLLMVSQFVAEEGFMVWIVGAEGHPARYLTRAYAAAWSPDGRSVVYANAHGDIYTISVAEGEPRLLHREEAPARQVTRTGFMSWSPDGTTIRFTREGRIYEISSTGANFHEWFPGWNRSVRKCCDRWTADGGLFIFLAGDALERSPYTSSLAEIWAVDERHRSVRPRISEPILLASGPLLWGVPIPSRDGKKIFARGVSLRSELERYDTVSNRLKPYLGGISADMPDFSKDGKYMAYVSFPDGVLWRADRDGTGLLQLTEPPFYPRNPRWSPDGTKVLFTDSTQNGVDAIYVVSSQGGSPKRLFPEDGGPQNLADWSPDGTRVVYTTLSWFSFLPWDESKVETRIVELATGRITVLPKRPGGFFAPLWSPDGRYIAGADYYDRALPVFDMKTGKWNTLIQDGTVGYHNWSHDGRFIYFVWWLQDKVGVYRVPVQGGRPELVFDFPEGFRGTGWYPDWMSLDPDDAPLVLRDAGTDEIYALTLETD